jgi:uncharacterized protein
MLYEKFTGQFNDFCLNYLKAESELKKFRKEQQRIIEIELNKWGA